MTEVPSGGQEDLAAGISDPEPSVPVGRRTITVDVDRKLGELLQILARWRGVSEEELVAEAIQRHPEVPDQRSLTVHISEASAMRLAAAAATIGMSEEQLIAEAIDTYSPAERAERFWPALGFPGLLVAAPLVLMFLSPPIGRSGSPMAWTLFAVAMLACCMGAVYLITTVVYAEWVVIKYGIVGLVAQVACGAVAVLSLFAYLYWLLSSLRPASFNLPLSRVDTVYFTLGTFTTTGTGRLAPQSSLAELLVCCQVVLGWGFVAILVALLVPRAAAARKRLSNGRIIVRTRTPDRG
jgi:hypothetical protein